MAGGGGLEVVGWLEGPTGLVETQRTRHNPKLLAFTVSLGSTYELVSAVYGRGRMLARLQNFTFQCPQVGGSILSVYLIMWENDIILLTHSIKTK